MSSPKPGAVAGGIDAAFGPAADLLGGVVRADRARGGRFDPVPNTGETRPGDTAADRHTTGQADLSYAPPDRRPTNRSTAGQLARLAADRRAEAAALARTPTTTVTLQLPTGLAAYLDEYVHRSWPDKVLKQDLVAEAVRLLFARRGRAGEPVLATDLFADGGEP